MINPLNTWARRLLAAMVVALLSACGGGGDAAPPPVVQISSSAGAIANAPVLFTFSFSQDVGTSFTADDVVVSLGSKGAFTRLSETRYTLLVTPPPGAVGSITVSLAATDYLNTYGTSGAANASVSQAFDAAPPTLAISSSVGAGAAAIGDLTLSFSFSEDVGTSFTADDVSVVFSAGTGQLMAFTRVSGSVWTLLIKPPAGASGRISVQVAAGAFSDLAGNANRAAANLTQDYDLVPPTLTLGSSAAGGVATGPFLLSFNFSEDVGTSFTSDDVLVSFSAGTGGSKGSLTRVSATQATMLITPPAGVKGQVSIGIAVGAFADLAGNANVSSYFGIQQYNTTGGP